MEESQCDASRDGVQSIAYHERKKLMHCPGVTLVFTPSPMSGLGRTDDHPFSI